MSEFFLKIVNMSISASWLVLVVLLLRLVLKKAPKWVSVLLWGFVAIRLILPFSLESVFSLIPNTETISPDIMMDRTPEVSTGIGIVDSAVNPIITGSFAPKPYASANPLQILIPVFGNLWVLGILGMVLYTFISYVVLRHRVTTAVLLRDNIYQSETVDSPFVLGIIKPKIYLPFNLDPRDLEHVIAHERSHIHRKDHWWKPLGFLLLAVHWFNPLMWLGYILLCRDIELACDEKVIRELDNESKADYTQALVTCSINRRRIAACPLAFGEVGVKQRVKAVLHYKKPAFWIIIAAIIICIVTAVCFLTDPAVSTDAQLSVFIDCQIAEHFQSEETEGRASCVNWKVLGTERNGKETTVYMWVLYEEYSLKDNDLYCETGAHIPTAITAKKENGGWQMVEYWEPRDGGYYVSDIKGKIPWYLWLKVLDSQRYVNKQEEENRKMAWAYFGKAYVLEEIAGNLKTYQHLSDGTWRVNGRNYKYRLPVTGRMHNAAVESTFVYLSNLETIPFERAWRAAGFSSNTADYFSPEEAVLVEWTHEEIAAGVFDEENKIATKPNSKLDAAISEAILNHNWQESEGMLRTESHMILANEVVSGTPKVGETNHFQEVTVFLYYLRLQFEADEPFPEKPDGTYGYGILTFEISENGTYTLKEFRDPKLSADYDAELMKRFSKAAEDAAKNEQANKQQLFTRCQIIGREYLNDWSAGISPQPGGTTY